MFVDWYVHLKSVHANGFSIPPGNMRKNSGFWMFSGGIERDQWQEMAYTNIQKFK